MKEIWQDFVNELPIPPEMIPLALAFAVIVIGAIGILVLGFSTAKIKSFTSGDKGKSLIPRETMDNLIKAYGKIFSTYNMKAAETMLTENMHYKTKCSVETLQKIGVKKEIDVKVDEENMKILENQAINIVMEDGKNDMTISVLPCEYTETYYNSVNDKKLYSNTKKGNLTVSFLKSNQVDREKTAYCINCGTPIEPNGDFYDCPNCKSHYSAENYKWTINDVQFNEEDKLLTGFILFSMVGLILLSVVASIVQKFWFGLGVSCINLLALGGVIAYLAWLKKVLSIFKVISADDKLFSRQTFIQRVMYLIRTLEIARDFEIGRTKAFMTPDIFEKIKAANKYDEFFLVDFNFKNAILSNYRLEGENRYVDVRIKLEQLILKKKKNDKKKLKIKTRKLNYTFMRHKDALTEVNEGYKTITCPCCGANINLTLDGKCKCCGDSYDISKYDWIISDAPIELTK